MDSQDYNTQNNKSEELIELKDDFPTENEILSNQNINNNNTDNIPQENNIPPPLPSEVYQPNSTDNIQQNPTPQAPYMKYGAAFNPNYLNNIPPIPAGNNDSYEPPVNNNQNAYLVPVQQQIVSQNNEVKELHLYNQAQNNQQIIQQKQGSCCDCCFDCLDCMCDCCEGCINCMCDCSCDCSEEDCGNIFLYIFCCICYILFAGLGN